MKRLMLLFIASLASLVSFGMSDTKWGEAWNTSSVIGLSNMAIDSNQDWNGHKAAGVRGADTELFDNVNDTNNDMLHTMSKGKLWVKMTVAADCQAGKDLVLKKYRISGYSDARSPKTWSIYGSANPSASWGDKSLVLIDSRANVAGTTSADYDCSANPTAFRTYFFYFEANNGDGLLQIKELYLFGEIKDHEEAIVYSVSMPYSGLYDGYAHGITVTPSYPETGVTVQYSADGETWQAESPVYKDVGEYTIHYRLTASGFPDVSGSRTITILEPPQEKLDITAVVREAEAASGSTYHQTTAANAFSGQAEFTDGVNNQRIGWGSGSAAGNNTLIYEILDAYRPGDEVTVTGLTFLVGSNVDHKTTDSMRAWKFEAWDAAKGEWKELESKTADEWQPWADADLDSTLSAYVRSAFFENTFVSRKYRLTTYSRTFLSDLRLLGNVIVPEDTQIVVAATDYIGEYDGAAHGISVKVTNPATGYTVSYRTDETAEWTTVAPTFTDPIQPQDAKTVFWKVEAEGYETVEGSNKVVLDYPDITALVRASGSGNHTIEAEDPLASESVANAIDGNLQTRIVYYGDTLSYAIGDAFRPDEAIVAKSLDIVVLNAEYASGNVPSAFSVQGYDATAEAWVPVADFDAPWTDADYDASLGLWSKTFSFTDNAESFRRYRIVTARPADGVMKKFSEMRLRGLVNVETAKNIVAAGSDYAANYDGAKHGISVSVTRPTSGAVVEYSLTGTDGWSTQPPVTKGPVSTACPVYWRVRATGYRTKTGVNTIQITDTALVDQDLTAAIREAGKSFYGVEAANGGFWQQAGGTPYNFVNGILSDRNGWVNPKTETGYLYLTISNEFRVAESVVVKAVAFAGPTNSNNVVDDGKIVLPKVWTIEGSTDGETWKTLAAYNADNYPAWGADDVVGVNYYRRSDFANTTSYRLYRLGFTGSRTHISEIYLYGDIGTPHPERPPRIPGGFTVIVK